MKTRKVNGNALEIYDENNNFILSIDEKVSADKCMLISLSGEIKNEVAHDFEDEIMAALSVCKKIEIDFEKVTYIASMALRSLLSVQQIIDEMNEAQMILKKISPEVMSVFKESGFSEILEIEE